MKLNEHEPVSQEPPNPESGYKVELAGGNVMSYGELEPITSKNPLKAAYSAAHNVCRLLVGEHHALRLKYYLAANLLASLNGWEWDEFKEMVDQAKEDPDNLSDDWETEDDSSNSVEADTSE